MFDFAVVPCLLDSVRPVLASCQETTSALASIIPPNQFWRWKDSWSNSLRTAVFSAALVEYLTSGTLITLTKVNETLGSESFAHTPVVRRLNVIHILLPVQAEWNDRFCLPIDDYLHGAISLVNELVCFLSRNIYWIPAIWVVRVR
jgi:hypothetical protein